MPTMRPEDIGIHPILSEVFSIQQELLDTITISMSDRGYDFSQPVIVAILEGQKEPICIDGHTRIQAAINAGIEQIPFFTREDLTEEEAVQELIRLQRHRRNMTDADLYACVGAIDERRKAGRPKKELAQHCANFSGEGAATDMGIVSDAAPANSKRKSAAAVAEMVGISPRKAEQIRTVRDHGTPETIEAVKKDEKSVNQAYNETQDRRRNEKVKKTGGNKTKALTDGALPGVAEPVEAVTGAVPADEATASGANNETVILSHTLYEELKKLGGSITHHVAKAITLYLKSLCGTEIAASHEHAA